MRTASGRFLGGWARRRALLLPLVFVTPLAASSGGYYATSWGWATLAFLWIGAMALAFNPELRLPRLELVLLAAWIVLFAWTAMSASWAASAASPAHESQRVLLYLSAVLATLVAMPKASYAGLVTGTWGVVSLVSLYSLATRLFPERLGVIDDVAGNRLSAPIGYWNSLGVLAAVGVLLAVGIAARGRSLVVAALAGASLVLLLPTLYFTFSRGAWIALGAGLIAAFLLDRHRLQLATAVLLLMPAPAIAVWLGATSDGLTRVGVPVDQAAHDGRKLATAILVLGAVAAAVTVALALAERRVVVTTVMRRAYALALLVALCVGLAAAFERYGAPPTLAADAWRSFKEPHPIVDQPENLNQRLFSLSGNQRYDEWRVAWNDHEEHRLLGSGAGTYEKYWLRHRPVASKVRDAHSLYLETLAELGPFGLLVLLVALGVPLVAGVTARRHRLVAPALGAYVAYVFHAGVDWDWELTGVTLTALFCGTSLVIAARRHGGARGISARGRTVAILVTLALAALALVGLVGNSAIANAEDALSSSHASAEREARKASRWAPWSPEPWRTLAQVQLARHDRQGALRNYRTAIAKDPHDWELWYELALVSEGRSRRRALQRAERLNPLSPELAQLRRAFSRDS